MAKDKKVEKKIDRIVYIGDSVGLDLIKDTVFIGGIPKRVLEKIKVIPELKYLLVPICEIVEKKKKLKEKDSLEFLANKKLKEVK